MKDYLQFKKMITPIMIQVIFWVGIVFTVIMGIGLMLKGGSGVLIGIAWLLLGPLFVRLYCEGIIVLFSINDTLTNIKNSLKNN